MSYDHLIEPLIVIARDAGKIIMQHYEGEAKVEIKADESPVTSADLAANEHIMKELRALVPDMNIVSEEEKNDSYGVNDTFFLVDPLDGTKSYIKRTGEFTVNIGLIENSVPVLGVVYIPALGAMYYGSETGAFKQMDGETAKPISVNESTSEGLVVMASQSHLNEETQAYINNLNVKQFNSAGSSLKFCYVAEGAADIYPRFGPTMEWDTAAADAVLRAAGGSMTNPDGTPFTYGKAEYRNGHFIASAT
jgi:3'(2'), 5'-bisphosphate nucleotidase